MSSLSEDSNEARIRKLQDEAARLLDLAVSPRHRARALDECIRVVREMNQLIDTDLLRRTGVRTVEQAHRDLAAGRLR